MSDVNHFQENTEDFRSAAEVVNTELPEAEELPKTEAVINEPSNCEANEENQQQNNQTTTT